MRAAVGGLPGKSALSAATTGRNGRERRFKIMLGHTWLISVAFLLLCAGITAVAYHVATLPTHLRISVGPPNSEDARVVQAITAQLARDRAPIRLNTTIEDSGARAAAAIDNGSADLAVVRQDIGMPKDGQAVAILRKNVVVFIVPSLPDPAKTAKPTKARPAKAPPKKEPIEAIGDLVGRRLGVIGRSQSNIELLKVILRQYSISTEKILMLTAADLARPNAPDRISVIQIDPYNVSSAIRDSNLDAIMSVGPVASTITADAILAATQGKEPPTFLSIGASEAIAERNSAYEATEIKAGAFGGSPPRPEESVDTIGFNHYIVANRNVSDSTIAEFTRLLFAVRNSVTAETPTAAKIETPDTDKGASVRVHPGAAAYVDGETKTLFERYGDFLYLGVMVFSLFGSALAAIASYSKADDRVRRLRSLEQLLEITKATRDAPTLQAVDDLQTQVDTIHADMIREVENDAVDDTAMTAYAISMDQVQLAITDRRATLLRQPQQPPPLAAVASL